MGMLRVGKQIVWAIVSLFLCFGGAQAEITSNLSGLSSTSHLANSSDYQIKRRITMSWSSAQVSEGASLSGYYYLFDNDDASSTSLADVLLADQQLGPSATSITSATLDDSNSHYFHIVAADNGGFGAVVTYGPIVINTRPDIQTVVDGDSDSSGVNSSDQTLTISGSRFMEAVTVTVATTTLQNVTRNGSTQLTATLPSGFDAGTHNVKVTNTSVSKSDTLNAAYTVTAANSAPTATAAAAQSTYTKDDATSTVTIQLNGTDSTDTDGDSLSSYTWSLDEYPEDASDNTTVSSGETTSYQTDVAGTYKFGLTVSDGTLTSSKSQVEVVVKDPGNAPPTANAGADQSVLVKDSATLNGGQSSDEEGAITYLWTLSAPNGSNATITNSNKVTATLTGIDLEGDYTVTLKVTDQGHPVTGVDKLTDTDEMVVTASIGDVSAATTLLSLDTTDTTVATTATVTVTPKDQNSNNLGAGEAVVIASTIGDVSDTVDQGNGTYTATITTTTSGTGVVSVTVNDVAINATDSLTFNPEAFDASSSTITASPAEAKDGDTITVSVTPKDEYGNKLAAGQSVTILEDAAGDMNGSVSESNGIYTQTYTMPALSNGDVVTFSAKVGGLDVDATDGVTFRTNAPNAAASSVTADATDNLTADSSDTATVTVTVKTASNSALEGEVVTLAFSDGDARDVIVNATDTTDASGTASFVVKSSLAGTKTVVASVGANGDSVELGTLDLTFVAGDATTLNIKSGNTQSVIVGNAANALIVTITDDYANAVSGETVNFAIISTDATDATGTLSAASDTTNNSGDASSTLTLATTSGYVTVSATLNGTSVSKTFTITAQPGTVDLGSSSSSIITVGDTSAATDTTASIQKDATSTIWLTLKDQYGNLVGNTDTSTGEELTVKFSHSGVLNGRYSKTATYVAASSAYKTVITAPASGDSFDTITATVGGTPLDKSVVVSYIEATFDVDGDGDADANDGVLIQRRLTGAGTVITGVSLPTGVGGSGTSGAKNNSEITAIIDSAGVTYDVDGDADADANDGVLIQRRLTGAGTVITGVSLPTGVGGSGTSGARTNAEVVQAIDALTP